VIACCQHGSGEGNYIFPAASPSLQINPEPRSEI
jgi:hypothetical protein